MIKSKVILGKPKVCNPGKPPVFNLIRCVNAYEKIIIDPKIHGYGSGLRCIGLIRYSLLR
jgi:hypothetical protein